MQPIQLIAQYLAHKLKAGKQAEGLGQAATMLGRDVGGYVSDTKLGSPDTSSWGQHAMQNAQLAERAGMEYGGWNRDSRNVKGYASAADYALRHPGLAQGAGVLAAAYQGADMLPAMVYPGTSPQQEYQDYQANQAGIQGAQLFPGSDPNNPKVQEALYERGRRYAEAINQRKAKGQ